MVHLFEKIIRGRVYEIHGPEMRAAMQSPKNKPLKNNSPYRPALSKEQISRNNSNLEKTRAAKKTIERQSIQQKTIQNLKNLGNSANVPIVKDIQRINTESLQNKTRIAEKRKEIYERTQNLLRNKERFKYDSKMQAKIDAQISSLNNYSSALSGKEATTYLLQQKIQNISADPKLSPVQKNKLVQKYYKDLANGTKNSMEAGNTLNYILRTKTQIIDSTTPDKAEEKAAYMNKMNDLTVLATFTPEVPINQKLVQDIREYSMVHPRDEASKYLLTGKNPRIILEDKSELEIDPVENKVFNIVNGSKTEIIGEEKNKVIIGLEESFTQNRVEKRKLVESFKNTFRRNEYDYRNLPKYMQNKAQVLYGRLNSPFLTQNDLEEISEEYAQLRKEWHKVAKGNQEAQIMQEDVEANYEQAEIIKDTSWQIGETIVTAPLGGAVLKVMGKGLKALSYSKQFPTLAKIMGTSNNILKGGSEVKLLSSSSNAVEKQMLSAGSAQFENNLIMSTNDVGRKLLFSGEKIKNAIPSTIQKIDSELNLIRNNMMNLTEQLKKTSRGTELYSKIRGELIELNRKSDRLNRILMKQKSKNFVGNAEDVVYLTDEIPAKIIRPTSSEISSALRNAISDTSKNSKVFGSAKNTVNSEVVKPTSKLRPLSEIKITDSSYKKLLRRNSKMTNNNEVFSKSPVLDTKGITNNELVNQYRQKIFNDYPGADGKLLNQYADLVIEHDLRAAANHKLYNELIGQSNPSKSDWAKYNFENKILEELSKKSSEIWPKIAKPNI